MKLKLYVAFMDEYSSRRCIGVFLDKERAEKESKDSNTYPLGAADGSIDIEEHELELVDEL